MRRALVLLAILAMPLYAIAAGHGPVFGLATPTNSKGEFSFDFGIFGRSSTFGTQGSIRGLVGYGFTPHLTVSLTLPAVISDTRLPPTRIQPGDGFPPWSHCDENATQR